MITVVRVYSMLGFVAPKIKYCLVIDDFGNI